MENLNIALIGCGMIGREHIERIQNRIRNAKVVAVCDVFEEGAGPVQAAITLKTNREIKGGIRWRQKSKRYATSGEKSS